MTTDAVSRVVEVLPVENDVKLGEAAVADTPSTTGDNTVYCYRAFTPLGKVFVSFQSAESASDPLSMWGEDNYVLEAARILGCEESLLELLELWLNVPLDLELVQNAEEGYAQVVIAPQGHSIDLVEGAALVSLPLNLLSKTAAPPAEMEESYTLRWRSVPCRVIIDRIVVPADQLRQLENGGLFMIPASFDVRWRCSVRTETEPKQQCTSFLESNKACLEVVSSIQSQIELDDANEVEVRCSQSFPVPIDYLLGWSQESHFLMPFSIVSCPVEMVNSHGLLAKGRLLPIGHGYAVYVEEMQEMATWI